MSGFLRKAFSNSVWTSGSSIANAVLGLFLAGLTIRWLGLEEAGFVLFLQAIVGANHSLVSLGLGGGCLRYVSEALGQKQAHRVRRLMETIAAFNLVSMGVLVVVLASLIPWFIEISEYQGSHEAAIFYGRFSLLGLYVGAFSKSFIQGLEAAQEFRFLSVYGVCMRLLTNGSKVAVLSLSPSLFALGVTELVLAILGAVLVAPKFRRVFGFFPRTRPSFAIFRELWKFSRWSYLQSLSNMVLGNLDRVVVGAFFSAQALPYYSMAKRGYLMGHEMIAGFASFFFPMLSSRGDDKHAIIERIESRVRWILTGIGIILYGGMVLVGPTLINWLVQPGFGTQIAPLILIFGCVGIVSIQTVMPYHISMATDRPWLTTACQYSNTICTFLATLAAASFGSLTGVAAAHFCDAIAVILFYILIRRENRQWRPLARQIFSPIATSLVAWVVILFGWSFLYSIEAPWFYWFIGAAVLLPSVALLAIFLERQRGDCYRHLETVRSIQMLAAERISFFGAIRIPFI
jgi:O-antigen/teichoic acid export membrane protein